MRINDKPPTPAGAAGPTHIANRRAEAAANPRAAQAAGANTASTPAVKVELSSRSRELLAALHAAQSAPDIRGDLVAKAKDAIANGTYTVDPQRIARGVLDIEA